MRLSKGLHDYNHTHRHLPGRMFETKYAGDNFEIFSDAVISMAKLCW